MDMLFSVMGMLYRYLLPSMAVGGIALLVWLAICLIGRRRLSLARWGLLFLFFTYLAAIPQVVGLSGLRLSDFSSGGASPNLVPVVQSVQDLMAYGLHALPQLLLNVVLYLPFGLLLTLLGKPSLWKVAACAAGYSGLMEALQYFAGRYCDIDDVLLNVAGAVIGWALVRGLRRLRRH